VLNALAERVFHVGEVGAGSAMKLSVNTVLAALNQALSEALVMAEKAGIDRAIAYNVFAATAVGAPFVQYKRLSFLRPEEGRVDFSISLLAKDLTLASALAADLHAPAQQLQADRRMLDEVINAGRADEDLSIVAEVLRAA
jgi:3-hydroxyisobutyrate dehydrogenase-like beta-hydroxyacid dehydrogenase